MHTHDVPTALLELIRKSGLWRLRAVEYLHGSSTLGPMKVWCGIFTKLRLFSLSEYRKVLFLDLDVVVLKNLDQIFSLEAPAGMLKGGLQPKHGAGIDGRSFFPTEQWNEPHGGINAGVMLLEPDAQVHAQMEREVVDDWHPEHIHSYGPEQEYLSRFYADRWTHISVGHNFQLYRLDPSRSFWKLEGAELADFGAPGEEILPKIQAAQWSSYPKPWTFLGLEPGAVEAAVAEAFRTHHAASAKLDAQLKARSLSLSLLQRWFHAHRSAELALPEGDREALLSIAASCRSEDVTS
mmetsp:Transcript_107590/g.343321  ORF Transcript_107590/g.343321 Transcript_107590/m.343321 type:complete len:295 (-) Transcript_107590:107-991(-)